MAAGSGASLSEHGAVSWERAPKPENMPEDGLPDEQERKDGYEAKATFLVNSRESSGLALISAGDATGRHDCCSESAQEHSGGVDCFRGVWQLYDGCSI